MGGKNEVNAHKHWPCGRIDGITRNEKRNLYCFGIPENLVILSVRFFFTSPSNGRTFLASDWLKSRESHFPRCSVNRQQEFLQPLRQRLRNKHSAIMRVRHSNIQQENYVLLFDEFVADRDRFAKCCIRKDQGRCLLFLECHFRVTCWIAMLYACHKWTSIGRLTFFKIRTLTNITRIKFPFTLKDTGLIRFKRSRTSWSHFKETLTIHHTLGDRTNQNAD